ncbi:MAG: LamG domain-containing protein, partial [Planctomycetota bacterium]
YTDIAIPKGATITAASVQFQVDEDKDGTLPVNLVIEGELAADAAGFTSDAYSVTSRPRTTALVQWSVPNWTTVGDRGPDQATPDIAAVIQEIVNQDGWASGNSLVLIISDDPANPSSGIRCAEAGPGDDAALLHIEYTEAPAPSPIAHWQFDESSGTIAADSSGSGLDGTVSGADWVSPGSDGAGSCLDFDGLGTDRVSLGTFDVIGDGISIACWYKADNLDTPGNDPRMFSKAIGGSREEHWFMVSSSRVSGEKRLRFRLKTDGATGELKASPDGTIELDVWTHVVASWDGETMRLHKNGVEVGNTAKGGTLSTDPTVKVSIGNQPEGVGDRPFDGLIDDVRVYNLGLSQAEIEAIVSGQ